MSDFDNLQLEGDPEEEPNEDAAQEEPIENEAPEESAPSEPPQPAAEPGISRENRLWATFAHLSALLGLVPPFVVLNLLGPLVIWLIKREQSFFVDEQGKEAVNFQISIAVYLIVAGLLSVVFVEYLLGLAVLLFMAVCAIIAAIKANHGESFRYPLSIRIIK